MKIYLARHGRSTYNDLGLCNADPRIDVPLTVTGINQAEALAKKLKIVPIDRIYHSQLKRTQQTAEIVNQYHGLPLMADYRLNDGRSGFEGKSFKEYDAALDAAPNRWTASFNDGESIEGIKKRVAGFMDELRTKQYDSVLIVTSLWIIFAITAVSEGLSNDKAWNLAIEQGNYSELDIS
jgi:broad specificity phosphatase PhoE